jgi:hypothetical protein
MYLSTGFLKMTSWLLAAALVVQPMAGFSCGCIEARRDGAKQPAKRRCCCCCSHAQHACRCCCCGMVAGGKKSRSPQRACCQRGPNHERPLPGVGICRCGLVPPAAPATPPERTPSNDLAAPVLYACGGTIDSPLLHRHEVDFGVPAAFVSASEHCIALCKLLC